MGGRTGGLVENQWVDNIEIATTTSGPPINLTRGATSITLNWGAGFWLQSTGSLPPTWNYVTGRSSPFTVTTTTGTQFYRLTSVPPPP